MVSGMRPSPQALSMGGVMPSATSTVRPCWAAAMAQARPAGPPPAMKTSGSGDARIWLLEWRGREGTYCLPVAISDY